LLTIAIRKTYFRSRQLGIYLITEDQPFPVIMFASRINSYSQNTTTGLPLFIEISTSHRYQANDSVDGA